MKSFASFVGLAVIVAVVTAGCSGGPCSGDFCVEIIDSSYLVDRCAADAGENCTFATVHFAAKDKGTAIADASELTANMKLNGRDTGVEGRGGLATAGYEQMLVMLLLDRSFSITESGSTEAVKSAALAFIESLPDSTLIEPALFASEDRVPLPLSEADCSHTSAVQVDKAKAARLITDCYKPYASQTSSSQTKLYDAVAQAGPGYRGIPNVLVVMTDGKDTASTAFRTPEAVLENHRLRELTWKVYTIGLGSEPDEKALGTLSDGKFFRASDAAALESAFAAVRKELTAIHTYKMLVAGREANAEGTLTVTHKGRTVEQTFELRF